MQESTWDSTRRNVSDTSSNAKQSIPLSEIALRVLRMRQVVQRTSLSRATLYSLISSDPTFPRKIRLSARAIGFLEHEIDAWILARSEKNEQRK